jgi:abortive infection bacteriophage resistance protein|tara:strand:- start:857 stop:1054 length:198 start_codon:yes stop_codon:yes gene_type:complete
MARKLKANEYRKLCREIHRKYKKSLDLPFWEACDLADSVWFGENSKEKLFELLDDAVKDEIQGAA